MDRRHFIQALAATGIGSATLHRAIAVQASTDLSQPITTEMVKNACWVVGAELTENQCKTLANTLNSENPSLKEFRKLDLPASDSPAVFFQPLNPPIPEPKANRQVKLPEEQNVRLPASDDQIAFLPVSKLSVLIKNKQITSTRLTKIYLDRLKRFGSQLKCVVNLTEQLALKQAAKADSEIQGGNYRGPLHGIPWGAKDLISVKDYPTTWGIPQFKNRKFEDDATVVRRLEEAGAVLVAKLSLGAIAMGDRWYGGTTRNPWNKRQGSSGSSAGSASATAAGLVGFSLGSETLGSILSPSQRCGTTGFRPTFGRVSRHGCMPLSWTMDKIGPITRSANDAALVFAAIHGVDPNDSSVNSYPLNWLERKDLSDLRVGYIKRGRKLERRPEIQILKKLGVQLVPVSLPPVRHFTQILHTIDVEGAAVFEAMLNRDETEGWNSWPSSFRRGQFVSAIDYLKVMRIRRKLMVETEKVFQDADFLINARDIFVTNLTGHPSITFPRRIRKIGTRSFIQNDVITGNNYQDGALLSLAYYYQQEVDGHLQQPTMDFPPLPDFLNQVTNPDQKKTPT